MSFGLSAIGTGTWGGYGPTDEGGPYLVSSSPEHSAVNVAQDEEIAITVYSAEGPIDLFTLKVLIGSYCAVAAGAFQAGSTGTIAVNGDGSVTITIATHPAFTSKVVYVTVDAHDSVSNRRFLWFSFSTALGLVEDLVARTHCEGKRIDLSWTNPAGVTRLRLARSTVGFSRFEDDPFEVLYEGAAIDAFVDGVYPRDGEVDEGIDTTNEELSEDKFYYYTVFITYSAAAPYEWVWDSGCHVTGLSIKDYYAQEGDYVYNLLPRHYRRRDGDASRGDDQYLLRDFCRLLQCQTNLLRGETEALLHVRDPEESPMGRVGAAENQLGLASARLLELGIDPEQALGADAVRRLIGGIIPQYLVKGTCPGYTSLVSLFAGWDSRCDEMLEPLCGIARMFTLWDGESYLVTAQGNDDTGYIQQPDNLLSIDKVLGGLSIDPADFPIEGPLLPRFVYDAFGTFVCLDPEDIADTGSAFVLGFQSQYARLRSSIGVTITSVTNLGATTEIVFTIDDDSRPWQFPNGEPWISENALEGLLFYDVIAGSDSFREIVSNEASTSGTVTCVITTAGIGPAPTTGASRIAYDWGGPVLARTPKFFLTLGIGGECSFIWNPVFDLRLLRETSAGPFSPLSGLANTGTYAPSPSDVTVWLQDVHTAGGTSTSVTGNTLTDTTKNWHPDHWIGYYLLANWHKPRLFRVLSNTATTLAVDAEGELDDYAPAGLPYVLLGERDALYFEQLRRLLLSFSSDDVDLSIKFENAWTPESLEGIFAEWCAGAEFMYGTFPAIATWANLWDETETLAPVGSAAEMQASYSTDFPAVVMTGGYLSRSVPAAELLANQTTFTLALLFHHTDGTVDQGLFTETTSGPALDLFTISVDGSNLLLTLFNGQTLNVNGVLTEGYWHVVVLRKNGTTWTLNVDDADAVTLTDTATWAAAASYTTRQWRLGYAGAASANFDGAVRHALMGTSEASDPEVAKLIRFMRLTWPDLAY